jgi:drug/metabolite transporter (DMT)-like permease
LPHRSRRRPPIRKRPLFKWFVAGGIVGIAVAFFLFYALSHELVIADYALIFWPASIALLATHDGFWAETLTITFAFIGNFLLYGLAAVIIGAVAKRVGRLSSHQ